MVTLHEDLRVFLRECRYLFIEEKNEECCLLGYNAV
jgi:hypothetical protein